MRVGGNVSYYRFFYASIYQVRDGGAGGGVSYCLFIFMYQDYSKIFCIPMLHTMHPWQISCQAVAQ